MGDGKQIWIWANNWLPSRNAARVTTPVIWGQEISSVEVLINLVTRSWRAEVIDHVFNKAEAEVIKSIPLSSCNQVDTLIWPFNPSSQYSFKSGYRFLQENSENPCAPVQDSAFWKKVWSLEVPSKIKNFVWRACKEALPTRRNLQRRKIILDGLCDTCKVRDEDCSHALFFCSDVQVLWSSEWPWLFDLQGRTVKEVFNHAFSEKKDVARKTHVH